jgi:hypothetical protein
MNDLSKWCDLVSSIRNPNEHDMNAQKEELHNYVVENITQHWKKLRFRLKGWIDFFSALFLYFQELKMVRPTTSWQAVEDFLNHPGDPTIKALEEMMVSEGSPTLVHDFGFSIINPQTRPYASPAFKNVVRAFVSSLVRIETSLEEDIASVKYVFADLGIELR